MTRLIAMLSLVAGVSSCASAPVSGSVEAKPQSSGVCDPSGPTVDFPLSPGGTPEASIEQVAQQGCRMRIVDVRDRDELDGELGAIPRAVHIEQRRVASEALDWDRDEPVVFVCRSGRRSGAVTRELRQMGFHRVASMTGGMLSWHEHGLPTVDGSTVRTVVAAEDHHAKRQVTRQDIVDHVADHDQVRFSKAASIMLDGTEACVDGRDAHPIVGTPGGDAGELVVALAAAERMSGKTFDKAELDRIFVAYVEAFGSFYMHSDEHAVEALVDELAARTGDAELPAGHDAHAAARLVQSPPEHLREQLLSLLVEPGYVGCGHLRLMLQHPEEYGIRAELAAEVLRTFYRHLWKNHRDLELVVLRGGHEESAVVTVELAHEVHAYSRIPLVSPRLEDTEIFVAHPQVARFVRRENAAFFLEQRVVSGVDEAEFFEDLDQLAGQQLSATLRHLAAGLPRYRVRFDGDEFVVVEGTVEP